ncbi:Gfo/Idh/MocA family protein [Williamsia soli]|uniref:Gfo/Idh/MocA family protein n=1 Tax=Williamsia soli TaxID=364929 RepID=UPI001A9DFBCF
MSQLRTVVLGVGKSGSLFVDALVSHPLVELSAVAAGSRLSAARIADPLGVVALGPTDDWTAYNPDLVVIATPHDCHAGQLVHALAYGSSVLCDKPLVTTPDQWFALMEAAANSNGGRVFCSLVQRCSPAMLECRDYLASRRAEITAVSVQQVLARSTAYYETWKGNLARSGGGVLMNQAIHALDLAQFVTASDFQLRSCSMLTVSEMEVETVVTALLTLNGGTPVVLAATTASATNESQIIRIALGQDLVVLVGSEVVSWGLIRHGAPVETQIAQLVRAGDVYGPGYREAVDDVVTSLLNGTQSRYRIELPDTDSLHRLVFEMYSRGRRD